MSPVVPFAYRSKPMLPYSSSLRRATLGLLFIGCFVFGALSTSLAKATPPGVTTEADRTPRNIPRFGEINRTNVSKLQDRLGISHGR